jgi:zinc-finger of transposase IS204/IS1001/IS1096/IS1165
MSTIGPSHIETVPNASAWRIYPTNGSVALSVVADCADVSRSVMIDVTVLVRTVFSGLSALVIEDVEDAGDMICVRARTRAGAVACPGCGAETARVHEYRERTVADVPVDGRRVLVRVRVRRMRCPALNCKMQTSASRSRASWTITSGASRG